ncbi:MAG: Orthopoxvirus protein of unknown function (DUF830) [Roseibaca calidilacus]|uniref:Permuted papain-like amidase enzyme, YaeF/YiiX, C92 family n=1 Tax=Roseibaca calidilacus TaxID=1666912 RepID=A0A0P7WWY8_9RHOB|nr:YiiX/YebB-like N1pC/P60 family cysteine hydrolase [Roseibaca calidilacus]KPP95804.1 MAG: Orthopoxvirus protein of unknown function (DUF830) [Roseibaca calidilacus]CUX81680.1 Permuted papain-like amidase enzyme, YaeF/YiiX, C92 family [Roseibaca calidilacus]
MSGAISIRDRIGQALGRWLERDRAQFEPRAALDPDMLIRTLRRGDVLLVEGRAKISTAIKYLTQSTWSHAALYVGDMLPGQGPHMLIEVTLQNGVHAVPLSKYARSNIRICRAVGLSEAERDAVARFMLDRIGYEYDLRNIIDLARYLFPTPPVPIRFRRRMLALGSGDPTRAICSSLIAQAFQSVRYPILPEIRRSRAHGSDYSRREIFHIRHHSLFVPRDFDLSPYFEIVKPTIRYGFDHGRIKWAAPDAEILG